MKNLILQPLLKIITLSALCLVVVLSIAQVPQAMNYQTVVRDASGTTLSNKNVTFRFTISAVLSGGNPLYQEIHNATTSIFGIVDFAIGNGTVIYGAFNAINWSSGSYYLTVEIDVTGGGGSYANMGTTQLISVPYALYAQTSGNSSGVTHYVGQLYQGGIIVSVWKDSSSIEHGLIASLADISTSSAWSNVTSTLIGSTAESYHIGNANTTAILGQAGQSSSAALLCHNYSGGGGYTDWYLPANWELRQCFNAVLIVNQVLGDSNGFSSGNYWSSTEYDVSTAWLQSFGFGNATNLSKATGCSVRAVRKY